MRIALQTATAILIVAAPKLGFADTGPATHPRANASGAASPRVAQAPNSDQRRAQAKREFELRRRQMLQEFERKSAAMKRDWEQRVPSRTGPSIRSIPSSVRQTPPFDPDAAPGPDRCFLEFVETARKAQSASEIMPFLPLSRQDVLRQQQAQYDPSSVGSKRAWFQQQNPGISEESLTHLTQSPYADALKWYQDIAERVIKVRSVKVDGNKAILGVATRHAATVNGIRYEYGTATVEMVGEGNYWRISSYNDSNIVFRNPPE